MSGEWLDSKGLSDMARERLSALVDGEVTSEDLQGVLGAGRESPRVLSITCQTWHAYHLIGDVMRSEDLAGAGRDSQFLGRLRERLAAEPVVMAPAAPEVRVSSAHLEWRNVAQGAPVARHRRSWVTPLAAAASVMAVTGVLVVSRVSDSPSGTPGGAPSLARAVPDTGEQVVAPQAAAVPADELRVVTANGTLVRDARLDQYLSAHKQFGGSSALGVPSGFLRSATYEGPSR